MKPIVEVYCSECGHEWRQVNLGPEKYICPNCGSSSTHPNPFITCNCGTTVYLDEDLNECENCGKKYDKKGNAIYNNYYIKLYVTIKGEAPINKHNLCLNIDEDGELILYPKNFNNNIIGGSINMVKKVWEP